MKKAQILLFWALSMGVATSTGFAHDRIRLRDGREIEGAILRENAAGYVVQTMQPFRQEQIPRNAVADVLYADAAVADRVLGLSRASRSIRNAHEATVVMLPAEAFGHTIVEAVRGAETSIWIASYILRGSVAGTIKEFYDLLQERAREGVEVVMLFEFSAGTRPALRHATLENVQHLSASGITVRFIQEHRSMHKKMIIVDGSRLFLGSSNLTLAGTQGSNEMNVRVDSPAMAREAGDDFRGLLDRSVGASELR